MDGRTASFRAGVVCFFLLWSGLGRAEQLDGFLPVAGNWRMDVDNGMRVLVADGGGYKVTAKEHFPVAVHTGTQDLQEGTVIVFFKPLAGKSDQAGGILFDRKANGDYLVLRANALEGNLNLYRHAAGRRTPIKEMDNAPAQTGVWHELKVVVWKSQVQGYLDGKLLLTHDLGRKVSGGVGLWSKDDSVTLFKNFHVTTGNP